MKMFENLKLCSFFCW